MKTAICSLVAATIVFGALTNANAGLVSNGGFETGDFTDWTQFGNTGFTGVSGNFSGVDPVEGSFQAFFGSVGSTGGISQSISTVVGGIYTFDFWLYNFGGNPNSFDASFNGVSVLSFTDDPGLSYTHFTFAGLIATGTSTQIQFTFQQNPSYWLLDDVDAVQTGTVPEPASALMWMMGLSGVAVLRKRTARRTMKV